MLEFNGNDREVQEVVASKVRDNVLLNIVHLTNLDEISVGLTLFCKGTVISGDVISGKEYFASMVENCKGEALKNLYSEIGKTFYEMDPAKGNEPPLNYIHLKKVAVQGSDSEFTPFLGGLLRMRIDEIDGHLLGRFE
ncbi:MULTISPECIES: hypothetical protein [Leclercia]|uniref:hypothetical protein n=1 Tax=Leclercia TaxID=83654 RepID=UPI0012E749E5|nr:MULTISPECIES: hypothetical protein [Leclercia]QGW17594.1 hypothetical protein GNG29_13975 [Leclercia sp. Colony189]URM21318.1 hypothetical protein JJN11_14365 [Leclercia adecarboxylata]